MAAVLKGAELSYSQIEKTTYAMIITTGRLRPYFQAHSIEVLINIPLEKKNWSWKDLVGW